MPVGHAAPADVLSPTVGLWFNIITPGGGILSVNYVPFTHSFLFI